MGKVYIRTYAYNAEKTLRRAVESVLGQTHVDFAYYLCDNGSTDGTRKIVEEYAHCDGRVKAFYNTANRAFWETEECWFLPYRIGDNDFYCTLDSDDEYLPAYFEEMLAFIDEYDLDIAACGSDFFSVADNKLVGRRLLNDDLVVQGTGFADHFPAYHQFMRTIWGKLFKGYTMRDTIQDPSVQGFPRAYGGDTYNAMRAFSNAKRVGVLAKSLHKYYISPKSVSYVIHPERVEADQILHEAAVKYLKQYGELSLRNGDFLFGVYMNALKDTLIVLLNADISIKEKLDSLIEMFNCEHTRQLAAWENFGIYIGQAKEMQNLRKEFFTISAKWLLALEEVPDEQAEDFCNIGEFVCAAADYAEGWIVFKKLFIDLLLDKGRLDEARDRIGELEELLPEDSEISELRERLTNWQDDSHFALNERA